jgi:hypothetical protein
MQIYCYYSETEKTKKIYIWARDLSVNYCELLTIIVVFFVFVNSNTELNESIRKNRWFLVCNIRLKKIFANGLRKPE